MILFAEVIFDLSRITADNTTLAFVGYLIVFIALITLYIVFHYIPVFLNAMTTTSCVPRCAWDPCGYEHLSGSAVRGQAARVDGAIPGNTRCPSTV